jgi:hypothetical protein
MPNHGFGRCDGHHKMVDCIGPLGTPPGGFLLRPGPDNWSPAQDQADAGAAKSTTEAELGHLY